MRTALVVGLLAFTAAAHADDRADCLKGDDRACGRIGRLKQLGALKPDKTRDVDVLVTLCGKALDAAKTPSDFRSVARPCTPLFSVQLQKAWDVMDEMSMEQPDDVLPALLTGYAEAVCPTLAKPIAGCSGKRAADATSMKPDAALAALSTMNAMVLTKEIGADKAKPLLAKFDPAWPRIVKHAER
jgi:hypothetical protein